MTRLQSAYELLNAYGEMIERAADNNVPYSDLVDDWTRVAEYIETLLEEEEEEN